MRTGTWAPWHLAGAAAVAACLAAAPSQAASVAIDSLSVGTVSLDITLDGYGSYSSSGAVAPPVVIRMGSYQDPITSGTASSGLATVQWKIYSAPGAADNPAPSGAVDGAAGTISVDFSSLRGQVTLSPTDVLDFPLWPLTNPPSGGSYDGSTGAYSLNWSNSFSATLPTFGAVSGTAAVGLAGTVSTVPVPAALWLFGSGLVALAGLARRPRVR